MMLALHEVLSETHDFFRLQIQRKVPGVQDVNLGPGVIFRTLLHRYRERRIVNVPKNEQRRLVVRKPLLHFGRTLRLF